MYPVDTYGRAYLTEAVKRQTGISKTEAGSLVESILRLIADALSRGESVQVTNFGTFEVRHKRARIGRNPKTRVEALITPRRVVTFRPSKKLAIRVEQLSEPKIRKRAAA
jgi:integration host factor subunit alpha